MHRMLKLGFCAVVLGGLTGCYDFTGQQGRLGFVSSLTLDGRQPWTPASPVAPGELTVRASEVVGTGAESPEVEVSARGAKLLPAGPGEARFVAGRAEVELGFTGVVSDQVTVASRRPKAACLSPLVVSAVGDRGCLGPIGLAGPSRFGVLVRDRREEALGYDPSRLTAFGVGLSHDSDGFLLQPPAEDRVTARLDGWELGALKVRAVAATEVVGLDLVVEDAIEEGRVLRAVGRTREGLPVYGLEVRWEVDGQHHRLGVDALLTDDPQVSVHYGPFSAAG